jgi:hypothetical protein
MNRGKLISLSTMRPVVVPDCPIGQMVRYTGDMANSPGVGAVVTIRSASQYGPQSYDVALEDGREFRGTHLDGSRWVVLDAVADAATVEILRAGVTAREATLKAQKTAAEQAFADTVRKLREQYQHLEQGAGPVVAARNIRSELKLRFPSVKFTVRTQKYSGGDSVSIVWTDGPTSEQVKAIADKYAGGWFDGMTDCYEYKRSPWTELFGEARYVFCNRDYSDKMVADAIRRTCARLGGMEAIPTVEDYRRGELWKFKQSGGCDVEREIRTALAKHTYCV